MAEKKRLNLKIQFGEAVSHIKEVKSHIAFTVCLFLCSALFGYFFRSNLTFLNEILKNLISKTEGLNTFGMIFFILQNNLQSALVSVLAGSLFGIFPIANSIMNGTVLGYVLGFSAQIEGFSVWWKLLPHGVFELPAILIALGIGIDWGFSLGKKYFLSCWQDKKILIILPLIIGIIFGTIHSFAYKNSDSLPAGISYALLTPYIILFYIILTFAVFLVFLIFTNEELRQYFKVKLYKSANTFLMIIVPLLIIAAFIEGVLIGFLG